MKLANLLVLPLSACLFLVGCEHTATPEYLMRHPNELQREVRNCQAQDANSLYCQMVMKTRTTFVQLIESMQSDPEAFGESILDAEMQTDALQEKLQAAKKHLQSVGDNKQAATAYRETQIALDDNHEDIAARLAVVGLSSPG